MNEAEFDKFADEYHAMHSASIKASGEGPEYFAEYKIMDLRREYIRRTGMGTPPRILDFGAGSGGSVPYMNSHFPGVELTCLDVSRRSLELAEARFPGGARYIRLEGNVLPFEQGSFDLVFAACVFHHIDLDEHEKILREWLRVLRPGGLAFIYEHNPYNPLTRRVVNSCAFDVNARLITANAMRRRIEGAGFAEVEIRYRLFFPHALRLLRAWETRLAWLPLGAQYYAVAMR